MNLNNMNNYCMTPEIHGYNNNNSNSNNYSNNNSYNKN